MRVEISECEERGGLLHVGSLEKGDFQDGAFEVDNFLLVINVLQEVLDIL
jgi:hypothetical protein